jgi:hypothetical protein
MDGGVWLISHPHHLTHGILCIGSETWTLTKQKKDLYAHLKEGSSDASPELCWRMESGGEDITQSYTNYLKNQIQLNVSK